MAPGSFRCSFCDDADEDLAERNGPPGVIFSAAGLGSDGKCPARMALKTPSEHGGFPNRAMLGEAGSGMLPASFRQLKVQGLGRLRL